MHGGGGTRGRGGIASTTREGSQPCMGGGTRGRGGIASTIREGSQPCMGGGGHKREEYS